MLDFHASTLGIPPLQVPQVLPDSAHIARHHCSAATVKALRGADLVRTSGGSISVPLALVATGTNLRYLYLALGLSVSERQLVEAGFESLGGIVRRRRRSWEAYQAALSVPVAQSAVVELH